MKRIFVNMIVAGALLAGGTAYAQNAADGNTGATAQKENVAKGKKMAEGKKGERATKPRYNPFEGIELTPEQQQKLQVLREGLGPVKLDKEQMAKIPENKNLTDEQKKQLKQERKAKKLEAKKKYLAGVKETLTPEQYVIFLENCYIYQPQGKAYKQDKNKDYKKSKDRKGGKDGKERKERKNGK